jgi:hypothetical protein
MPLPFVTNDVGFALAHDIFNNPNDLRFIKKELAEIELVNPAVAEFISSWSKSAEDKDAKIHSAFCGILVYKLLENQAEADDMEKELNLGD